MFDKIDDRLVFALPSHSSVVATIKSQRGEQAVWDANKTHLFDLLKACRSESQLSRNSLSPLVLADLLRVNPRGVNLAAARAMSSDTMRVLDFSPESEEIADFSSFLRGFGFDAVEEEIHAVLSVGAAMGWSYAQSATVVSRARKSNKTFSISPVAVAAAIVCRMDYLAYPVGNYRASLGSAPTGNWYSRASRLYRATKNPETPLYCTLPLTDDQVLQIGQFHDTFEQFVEQMMEGIKHDNIIVAFENGIDFDLISSIQQGYDGVLGLSAA